MNQEDLVLQYMKDHKGITSMEAFRLGVTRLSAVIFNLRAKYEVKDVWERSINRYGVEVKYKRYYITKETPFWKKFVEKMKNNA